MNIKYEIYQRKTDKPHFFQLDNHQLFSNDYEKTYEGNMNGDTSSTTLDFLFAKFNADDRPTKDYTFSFSVNDMIKLDKQLYICLFVGWRKVNQNFIIVDVNNNLFPIN